MKHADQIPSHMEHKTNEKATFHRESQPSTENRLHVQVEEMKFDQKRSCVNAELNRHVVQKRICFPDLRTAAPNLDQRSSNLDTMQIKYLKLEIAIGIAYQKSRGPACKKP